MTHSETTPATPEGDAISAIMAELRMRKASALAYRSGTSPDDLEYRMFHGAALELDALIRFVDGIRSLPPQDGERLTDDGWIDAAVRQQKLVKLWKARCEQLWNAAWEHVEAFSILEDSVQIAARAKIEAILGQEAFPAALTAQPVALPTCLHLTADMADRCQTCNPGANQNYADPVSSAALLPGDGWRGIESAPKDVEFLACCAVPYDLCHAVVVDGAIYAVSDGGVFNGATHWMPLPAPPASVPQGEVKG